MASEREAFYDAEIAPILYDLAKRCEAHGIGFVASVEYDPNEFGTTATIPADHTDGIAMTYMAAKSNGNIDALAIGWARRVRESGRGHNSIVLQQMGVELAPSTPKEGGGH